MSICWLCVFVWPLLGEWVHCLNALTDKPPVLSAWDHEELFLAEGSPLSLGCPAALGSDLSFRWFKDGKPLNVDGDVLRIARLMPTDSALYRCSAANSFGTVISSPLSVHVLCKLKISLFCRGVLQFSFVVFIRERKNESFLRYLHTKK